MATWRVTLIMVATERRSGSYRTRNCISSCMYAVTLRWYVKTSSLRDRDLSRNQSATIYFLCNESSIFIHVRNYSSWYLCRYDTIPYIHSYTSYVLYNISLYCAHTRINSQNRTAIFGAEYMRPCILYPASTPSCGTRVHYYVSSAEGLNGAADVQFSLCFWSAYNISRTCLLSL